MLSEKDSEKVKEFLKKRIGKDIPVKYLMKMQALDKIGYTDITTLGLQLGDELIILEVKNYGELFPALLYDAFVITLEKEKTKNRKAKKKEITKQ